MSTRERAEARRLRLLLLYGLIYLAVAASLIGLAGAVYVRFDIDAGWFFPAFVACLFAATTIVERICGTWTEWLERLEPGLAPPRPVPPPRGQAAPAVAMFAAGVDPSNPPGSERPGPAPSGGSPTGPARAGPQPPRLRILALLCGLGAIGFLAVYPPWVVRLPPSSYQPVERVYPQGHDWLWAPRANAAIDWSKLCLEWVAAAVATGITVLVVGSRRWPAGAPKTPGERILDAADRSWRRDVGRKVVFVAVCAAAGMFLGGLALNTLADIGRPGLGALALVLIVILFLCYLVSTIRHWDRNDRDSARP